MCISVWVARPMRGKRAERKLSRSIISEILLSWRLPGYYEMAEGNATAEGTGEPEPQAAVTVGRGMVKETLRELLFEIPGFRTLAKRGLPPSMIGQAPRGETGEAASDAEVHPAMG